MHMYFTTLVVVLFLITEHLLPQGEEGNRKGVCVCVCVDVSVSAGNAGCR